MSESIVVTRVMKGYRLPEGEYIIEEWNASAGIWKQERSSTCSQKILRSIRKILQRNYNKGTLAFFRVSGYLFTKNHK